MYVLHHSQALLEIFFREDMKCCQVLFCLAMIKWEQVFCVNMSRRSCFYENSGIKAWHTSQTFSQFIRPCNGTPVFWHWQEKTSGSTGACEHTGKIRIHLKNFGMATGSQDNTRNSDVHDLNQQRSFPCDEKFVVQILATQAIFKHSQEHCVHLCFWKAQ